MAVTNRGRFVRRISRRCPCPGTADRSAPRSSSGESPAVARSRVRLAVRAAREARGLTQGHVAEDLDWSLSKVNRIENGQVSVSRTDLLAMLELYGVDDQDQIDDLGSVRRFRVAEQVLHVERGGRRTATCCPAPSSASKPRRWRPTATNAGRARSAAHRGVRQLQPSLEGSTKVQRKG